MLVRLLEIRQQQPDTLAYSTGETSITWSQLYRQSKSIAHQLDKQGVRPRHRICLYLDDCLEWIVIHHAMIMLGAIPAMLHVKTEHMPTVGNFDYIVGEVDKIGTINGYLKIMLHELDFEKNLPWTNFYDYTDTDIFCMYNTSGTTGISKFATFTHDSIFEPFKEINPYKFTANSNVLCAVKLSTSYARMVANLAPLFIGMHVILLSDTKDLKQMPYLVDRYKLTHLAVVPRILDFLVTSKVGKLSESHLIVLCAGGILTETLTKQAESQLGIDLCDNYGNTETTCWALFTNPDKIYGSVGKANTPGLTYKIIRKDGSECADNEHGEMTFYGKGVAVGYHNDPIGSQHKFRNGWFYSGDIFYRNSEGFYFFVSRKDQQIIIGGNVTYCSTIEDIIKSAPNVLDCTVLHDSEQTSQQSLTIFVSLSSNIPCTILLDKISIYQQNIIEILIVKVLPHTINHKKMRIKSDLMQYVIGSITASGQAEYRVNHL